MSILRNGIESKYKILHNGNSLKKGYHNSDVEILPGGSTVTYCVDSGVSYTEEVNNGESCLTPKTFTPTKDGWVFVGWREDTSGTTVLTSKVMGDDPITLYAVFKQTITLSTVSNGSTAKQTGARYYNASGNIKNPTFTVANPTRSGWTFLGWSTSSSSTTVANETISNLELSANKTLYAVWDCADVSGTASLNYNPGTKLYTGNETQATILSGVDTSKYLAVQFTFASGNIHVSVDYRGTQLDMFVSDGTNKTRIGYAYVDWTGTSGTKYTNQGIVLTPTLTFASNSGTKNILLTSECHTYNSATSTSSNGWVYVIGVTYKLIGRTVVY